MRETKKFETNGKVKMKKRLINIMVVGICLLLVGCATGGSKKYRWVHPEKNSSQFSNDHNSCVEIVSKDVNLRLKSAFAWGSGRPGATDREWNKKISQCLKSKGWKLEVLK